MKGEFEENLLKEAICYYRISIYFPLPLFLSYILYTSLTLSIPFISLSNLLPLSLLLYYLYLCLNLLLLVFDNREEVETAKELVRLGVDVNEYPSFLLAVEHGFTSLVTDMIEKGARLNQRSVCTYWRLVSLFMYFGRGAMTRFHAQEQYGTSNSKLQPHCFGLDLM